MNWQFFDKYLEENGNFGECIRNVEEKNFYIKKYIPYGKRKIRMAFGLYNDRAIHYEKVVKYLEKLDLPYVKLEYRKIKRMSFFDRVSIIVTKDCGLTFENFVNDFEKNKELIIKFYDIFIILVKNKIYPIDYNTGGMLIDTNRREKNRRMWRIFKKSNQKNYKRIKLESLIWKENYVL